MKRMLAIVSGVLVTVALWMATGQAQGGFSFFVASDLPMTILAPGWSARSSRAAAINVRPFQM